MSRRNRGKSEVKKSEQWSQTKREIKAEDLSDQIKIGKELARALFGEHTIKPFQHIIQLSKTRQQITDDLVAVLFKQADLDTGSYLHGIIKRKFKPGVDDIRVTLLLEVFNYLNSQHLTKPKIQLLLLKDSQGNTPLCHLLDYRVSKTIAPEKMKSINLPLIHKLLMFFDIEELEKLKLNYDTLNNILSDFEKSYDNAITRINKFYKRPWQWTLAKNAIDDKISRLRVKLLAMRDAKKANGENRQALASKPPAQRLPAKLPSRLSFASNSSPPAELKDSPHSQKRAKQTVSGLLFLRSADNKLPAAESMQVGSLEEQHEELSDLEFPDHPHNEDQMIIPPQPKEHGRFLADSKAASEPPLKKPKSFHEIGSWIRPIGGELIEQFEEEISAEKILEDGKKMR